MFKVGDKVRVTMAYIDEEHVGKEFTLVAVPDGPSDWMASRDAEGPACYYEAILNDADGNYMDHLMFKENELEPVV